MAVVYLITDYGNMSLDATDSVQQTFTNQVTEYPVESGFDYTKGVLAKSDTYSVSGIISDYHLSDSRDFRSDESLTLLKQVKEARSTVTLVARSRVITDLVIESINAIESVSDGYSKRVTINLKEVRTASSATTTVPRTAKVVEATGDDVADLTDSTSNKGSKAKEALSEEEEEDQYTTLAGWFKDGYEYLEEESE